MSSMWQDEWKRWQKELAARDPEALRELEAQSDEEKLEAFAGKMAFGTGGLRSILGMGPARMNVYTVARATEGLSRVILGSDAPKSVAIAYDTRKNSDVFARAAARVFLGNGIRVVLCSVLPCDRFSWRPEIAPAEKVRALNALLREYAARQGIVYVDYHSAFDNGQGGLDARFSEDGCHPTLYGYTLMEPMVVKGINKALRTRKERYTTPTPAL